jgi:hypothetical protein
LDVLLSSIRGGIIFLEGETHAGIMASSFPVFVVMAGRHQYPYLVSRLEDLSPIEPLAPFAPKGERGLLGEIPVAIFPELPGRETALVPVIRSPARFFLILAAVGGLQPDIERGDILVPTASIRGEGLTRYYARPDLPAVIDLDVGSALKNAAGRLGVKIRTGVFHTTASMYKEPEYVEELSELGVIGVQMELAQFYLLAQLEGKKAGAVHVVTDNPVTGERIWEKGMTRDQTLDNGLNSAADLVCEAIRELAGRERPSPVKAPSQLEP